MSIYCFYWGDGKDECFYMEIDVDAETVKKLLDEYRDEDEEYDNWGWAEFLESRDIKYRFIEAEHYIYF